jgi:hypothetical protein
MSNIIDTGTVAAPRSAVAWPAIFAGSVTGAAVSVILVLLGAGFGLAAVSPWGGNFSPTTFGVSAAIWLIVIEWVSAAFAGYFAGRLRTRMTGFHTDEVFFRDTAHGFVSWSFSLIILTAIFASSLAGIVGKTVDAAATVASGAAQGAGSAAGGAMTAMSGNFDPNAYLTDRLFRAAPGGGMAAGTEAAPVGTEAAAPSAPAPAATADRSATAPADTTAAPTDTTAAAAPADTTTAAAPADTTTAPPPAAAPMAQSAPASGATASPMMTPAAGQSNADAVRAEGGRILLQSLAAGQIAPEDRTYLAGLVAEQTGIPQAEAEQRVDSAMTDAQAAATKAKEAADAARSAAAKASLFLALSLLVGAFIACVAAALGGKERDDMETVLAGRP